MALQFPVTADPAVTSDEVLAAALENPGFGQVFSDHMAGATWDQDSGWHDDAVIGYRPFQLDPAVAVLHYGQEVFEGLKAYRHDDGSVWLFRPQLNARRFNASARRLGLPELPEADFLASITSLVQADQRWVPAGGEKSLYLRPFMFANEAFLGVRPALTVQYAVITGPVGPYFSSGVKPVDIWVTTQYSRAGAGGTGAAKCGGNYASSLLAQREAAEHGCSQVLFTDAASHTWLEELGGMNVFLVTDDHRLITPPVCGTILDGVTRDSILTLAPSFGLTTEVRPVALTELIDGIRSGRVVEAFACGTAAVITPIGSFVQDRAEPARLAQPEGEKAAALRAHLLDIQYGRVADQHGWTLRICQEPGAPVRR